MTDEQKTIYALGLLVQRSLKAFDLDSTELDILKRSLSDAARAIGITQPAASQHIASLEAQLEEILLAAPGAARKAKAMGLALAGAYVWRRRRSAP